MGDHSAIEWTDATWNPVTGCTRVSAGCDNCYAARETATRLRGKRQYEGLAVLTPSGRAAFNGKIRLLPERLDQPLRWREPRCVFVNSMSDLFHEGVPDEYIDQVFAVMALASTHTFQVLTKRPERMREYMTLKMDRPLGECVEARVGAAAMLIAIDRGEAVEQPTWGMWWDWPLRNVWLGTSVEDQAAADDRIPHLLQTPAAVRFLSCEPLLGPVDWRQSCCTCSWFVDAERSRHNLACPLSFYGDRRGPREWPIHWVIVGGESGPHARPMDLAWARSIVADCRAAQVPVFVKQLGRTPLMNYYEWAEWAGEQGWGDDLPVYVTVRREGGRHVYHRWYLEPGGRWDGQPPLNAWVEVPMGDRKGGDPSEWPEDLRIREWPCQS